MEKLDVLMKHNTLVNAQYNITLNENRVFVYLLYQFQKGDFGELSCTLSRTELSALFNRRSDGTIQGISKHLNSLRKKDLKLFDLKEDGSYDYIEYGFINGFVYNSKEDTFTITANERVYNLLHKYLEEGYTPINLEIWLGLKNTYAQRLYDLLRAWSGTKKDITYTVSRLRELMLLDSKYKQYTDFRKRVIIPAIEELNSTGYFSITYNEIKEGRSIGAINFHVNDLDKRIYFSDATKKLAISNNKKNDDFFIPDIKIFSKGTLRSFEKDFKHINFQNKYMCEAFDTSVMITLDRDNINQIGIKSYSYFKTVLANKIEEYREAELKDRKHEDEMEKYW